MAYQSLQIGLKEDKENYFFGFEIWSGFGELEVPASLHLCLCRTSRPQEIEEMIFKRL